MYKNPFSSGDLDAEDELFSKIAEAVAALKLMITEAAPQSVAPAAYLDLLGWLEDMDSDGLAKIRFCLAALTEQESAAIEAAHITAERRAYRAASGVQFGAVRC